MADEELDSLFDYRRVQPKTFISLDDDELDVFPVSPKRRKVINSEVGKVEKDRETIHVLDLEEEEKESEDWLLPPPKVSCPAGVLAENSTIKELRLMKQELLSCAQSAEDVLRSMDESRKAEVGKSLQPSLDAVADQPSRQHTERAKIVISLQDKDGLKQFRIYMDDKFERLFKLYADKVKLDLRSLVFCFDGEKIGPEATPNSLGIEDDDLIEVHVKSS